MKKIRKVLICYLIFFLFINIINSCGGVADYYRINSLNSVAQRIVSLDKNGNYIADDLNTFSDTIRIRYDSLRIKLTTDNYLALNNQTKSNIGIQSALAWSKAVEYEKIFEIEITSNKDYNSVYKAGTNLKKIMSFGDVTKCSIDSYLQYYDASAIEAYLVFNIPPEFDEIHMISIKYITENTNEFETFIENLFITK